jgi:folate-binding protein YgfZ
MQHWFSLTITGHMMTQWHEFLASKGASFADGQVSDYGNSSTELQAAANGNVLADLSHLGLLQVEGTDAATFLQGQFTNDIRQLDGNTSQYTGYCNPKGRLLALFLAFAHQDHIHLQLNGTLLEAMMKRLRMYVLRSKVTITDVSGDIVRMGVAGENAAASLQQIFTQVPQQPHESVTLENATLLRLPGPLPRYEVFSNIANAPAIWSHLAGSHTPVGKSGWDWLEIQAGIPDITLETQEEFVPQMINLDALDAINYKKGCYTGQEIVARTHYLGKIKRRTQLAHIAAEQLPLAGDDVLGAESNPVGKIVRSSPSPHGGFDVLAELRLESLQSNIQWQSVALQIKPLPYSLD